MLTKLIISLSLCMACVLSVEINTSSGHVKGQTVSFRNVSVNEFLAIPYAEPPVGSLRFLKPVPLKQPKTLIDGTKSGNSCFQFGHQPTVPVGEDCLILNVWSPVSINASVLKPVMFWIHGGGFYGGSAVEGPNGTYMASDDVVVVSINYRLGPFGFLYSGEESAPGNVGLYDQNLALKWVNQNIHSFGGNPKEITIFGESAGSWSVSAQILSPLSKGLFKRAILQSGAIFNDKNMERLNKTAALAEAKSYANYFNCSDAHWVDCLRKVGAKELNDHVAFMPYAIHETEFLPMIAQKAFKANNYNNDIDIIAGVMQREGSSLSPAQAKTLKSSDDFSALISTLHWSNFPELDAKKITDFYLKGVDPKNSTSLMIAYYEFFGDLFITCSTYHFAKQFAQSSPKRDVYFYEFTHPISADNMGATHGSDVAYVFGYPLRYRQPDSRFSEDIMKIWTNFAKNGKPLNGFPADPIWPRFIGIGTEHNVTKTKELNPTKANHIIDNIFATTCDGFWKNYFV